MVRDEQAGAAEGQSVRFAVLLRGADDVGTPIGTVSLFQLDEGNRRAELGYALRRSAWGRGYATEAVSAVIDQAFGPLDLNRLEADIDPHNHASARLLQRLASGTRACSGSGGSSPGKCATPPSTASSGPSGAPPDRLPPCEPP